jgi:hypothetical protein
MAYFGYVAVVHTKRLGRALCGHLVTRIDRGQ